MVEELSPHRCQQSREMDNARIHKTTETKAVPALRCYTCPRIRRIIPPSLRGSYNPDKPVDEISYYIY